MIARGTHQRLKLWPPFLAPRNRHMHMIVLMCNPHEYKSLPTPSSSRRSEEHHLRGGRRMDDALGQDRCHHLMECYREGGCLLRHSRELRHGQPV